MLNHEIAKTRDMVTDTNLGLIRLQWWRDEISKMYRGEQRGNIPILSTLSSVVHAQNIPQEWFDELLFAREFDLMDKAPANFQGLCKYAEFTTAPLNRIAIKMMGEEAGDDEIRHVSMNYGLMECIRGVPYVLTHHRCLLPEDMLDDLSLTSQKIIDFNCKDSIIEIVGRIVNQIHPVQRPTSSFLNLQQTITFICLNTLKKLKFDVFDGAMGAPSPFLALKLLWSSLKF